jgi:hypothetical protein
MINNGLLVDREEPAETRLVQGYLFVALGALLFKSPAS